MLKKLLLGCIPFIYQLFCLRCENHSGNLWRFNSYFIHFRNGMEVNLWDITSCSKMWSAKSVSANLFFDLLADIVANFYLY